MKMEKHTQKKTQKGQNKGKWSQIAEIPAISDAKAPEASCDEP